MNINEKMSWLEKLSSGEASFDEVKRNVESNDEPKETLEEELTAKSTKKFLHVKIDSGEGDKVNIKVPLGLGKFILKRGNIFNKTSIDESDIDIEEVIKMLEDGEIGDLVDIESSSGDRVKIFVK